MDCPGVLVGESAHLVKVETTIHCRADWTEFTGLKVGEQAWSAWFPHFIMSIWPGLAWEDWAFSSGVKLLTLPYPV